MTPAQLAETRKLQREWGVREDVDDTHALMNLSYTCGLCGQDPLCSDCACRGRKFWGMDLCCQCIFDTDGRQANHGRISSLPGVAMEPFPEDAGEPLPPLEVAKSSAPKPPSVTPPIGLLKRKSPMFPEGVKCACCGIVAGALSVTPAQLAKKRKLQSERGFPEDVEDTHALMNFSSTCGLCRKDPRCSECAGRGRKLRGTDLCCQCIFDTDGTLANHGGIARGWNLRPTTHRP